MNFIKDIKKLCTPAYVYLVISAISIIIMIIQNAGNTTTFCLGDNQCNVPHTGFVFIGQILYVAFWTFVLNSICKAGYKNISWFLVLLPLILFFVSLGLMMLLVANIEVQSML